MLRIVYCISAVIEINADACVVKDSVALKQVAPTVIEATATQRNAVTTVGCNGVEISGTRPTNDGGVGVINMNAVAHVAKA